MASYCIESDLEDFGVDAATAYLDLTTACELASRVIDNFTGNTTYGFGGVTTTTETINDVRRPLVRLPKFANVTAVTVNSSVIDPSGYTVEQFGLRLYVPGFIDVDGFPARVFTSIYPQGGPFGAKVQVTADFGYSSVPSPVKRACVILGSKFSTQGVIDAIPDPRIKQLRTEDYMITLQEGSEMLDTTGDFTADILLQPYRKVMVS